MAAGPFVRSDRFMADVFAPAGRWGARVRADDTIMVAAKGLLFCDLAGETAILQIESGTYFGLNSIGAFIWNAIQTPTTFPTLRDAVLNEYDVEAAQCEQDLRALLDELQAARLIELQDATGA